LVDKNDGRCVKGHIQLFLVKISPQEIGVLSIVDNSIIRIKKLYFDSAHNKTVQHKL